MPGRIATVAERPADPRPRAAGWLVLIGVALILIGMALARRDARPEAEGHRPLRGHDAPDLPGRVTSRPVPLPGRAG